jgi:acyl-CoA thioester hydrolase
MQDRTDLAGRGEGRASITLAQEVRRGEHVLVRAQVRVAFISEGRAQPIPKALRTLLKADLI